MRNLLFTALAAIALVSCGNGTSKSSETTMDSMPADSSAKLEIVGAWVQPIPGQDSVQGMILKEDNTAESINCASIKPQSWTLDGNTLTVVTIFESNSGTQQDTIAYEVVKADADSLVLKTDAFGVESYSRRK